MKDMNTENKVQDNIKKENKRAFKGFVGVIIVGGICGGIIGFLTSLISQCGTLSPEKAIENALFTFTPFMLPILFIVCGLIILYYYRQAKSLHRSWDGENEYTVNDAEMNISKAMLAASVGSIMGLFFMGIQIFNMINGREEGIIARTLVMLGFVVLMFFFVFCQKKMVDFTKILNPEKKGSAYDLKFQDIWLESCDEAEKNKIYQSGYAAYKFMNMFLVVLWAITMFISIGFGTGLLAMTMVSASWLAMNLTYCLKAMKLEKIK